MADASARAARAFLFKRGITRVSPARFAAAAREMKVDFTQLLFLLGLLHDGPAAAEHTVRERTLDAEQLKLMEAA